MCVYSVSVHPTVHSGVSVPCVTEPDTATVVYTVAVCIASTATDSQGDTTVLHTHARTHARARTHRGEDNDVWCVMNAFF